jgi:hypothetical protein
MADSPAPPLDVQPFREVLCEWLACAATDTGAISAAAVAGRASTAAATYNAVRAAVPADGPLTTPGVLDAAAARLAAFATAHAAAFAAARATWAQSAPESDDGDDSAEARGDDAVLAFVRGIGTLGVIAATIPLLGCLDAASTEDMLYDVVCAWETAAPE